MVSPWASAFVMTTSQVPSLHHSWRSRTEALRQTSARMLPTGFATARISIELSQGAARSCSRKPRSIRALLTILIGFSHAF
jgi:hypothetical protein